jgi:hypothetical protein
VRELLTPNPRDGMLSRTEQVAVDVFALAMVYRSKLNFTDMARELARYTKTDNSLSRTPEALLASQDFILAAAIQLAVEQVLIDAKLDGRFEKEPGFEHLAIDALYHIGRRWEEGGDKDEQNERSGKVNISRTELKTALLSRRRIMHSKSCPCEPEAKAGDGPDTGDAAPAPERPAGKKGGKADEGKALKVATDPDDDDIPNGDLDVLTDLVDALANYLTDFSQLATALRNRATPASDHADILPTGGLLSRDEGKQDLYSFVLNEEGQPLNEVVVIFEALDAAPAETPSSLLEAISELLANTGLTIDLLVRHRVLPATLSDRLLQQTIADLRATTDPNSELGRRGSSARTRIAQAFDSYGNRLADVLILLVELTQQFGDRPSVILERISRYFPPDVMPVIGEDWPLNLKNYTLEGSAASIRKFIAMLDNMRADTPVPTNPDIAAGWTKWHRRLQNYLCLNQPGAVELDYMDFVLAAGKLGPASLFRADLTQMDLIDWSEAARAALPGAGPILAAPPWLLYASLKALGFGRSHLKFLWNGPLQPTVEAQEFIDAAVETRPAGILHVYKEIAADQRAFWSVPDSRPMLAIGVNDLSAYMESLNHLAVAGLIEGGTADSDALN